MSPPVRWVSEILEGASTPQVEDSSSHQISPDSHLAIAGEEPTSRERKIAELIARYQAGQFTPEVRARLAKRFADNPPDAEERVLRACDHLGVTGEGLAEADQLAQEAYEAAGWPRLVG